MPKNRPLTASRSEFARNDDDVSGGRDNVCVIDGDVYDEGDEADYPELCVRLLCQVRLLAMQR